MDEAGCPFCFTIDGDTLKDNTVTVRHRDTQQHIRRVTLQDRPQRHGQRRPPLPLVDAVDERHLEQHVRPGPASLLDQTAHGAAVVVLVPPRVLDVPLDLHPAPELVRDRADGHHVAVQQPGRGRVEHLSGHRVEVHVPEDPIRLVGPSTRVAACGVNPPANRNRSPIASPAANS